VKVLLELHKRPYNCIKSLQCIYRQDKFYNVIKHNCRHLSTKVGEFVFWYVKVSYGKNQILRLETFFLLSSSV